jgi:5-deoxy-glucuronate isomerase
MPEIIRCYDNRNSPIVDEKNVTLRRTYFNLIRLGGGEEYRSRLDGWESVYVVMSGNCRIGVDDEVFDDVGKRQGIWSGKADSVYVPTGASVTVRASCDGTEIAVAGGRCAAVYTPFRVTPDEVELVEVGSKETHSRRRIFHVLGHNAKGRAGNLLVSELFCDGGCWCGYPPHKHDEDAQSPPGEFAETAFEELYHYRYNPETGFGGQFVFRKDWSSNCYLTRNGDTVLIDRGYHPNVASPGHEEYIFTILVGDVHRSLVQNFKEEFRSLTEAIPGIQDMRAAFK